MRKVLILGATGSIGTTFLTYLRRNVGQFRVVGLVSSHKREELEKLGEEFESPTLLTNGDIYSSNLKEFISTNSPDIVLNAISGFDGLFATKTVLENKIDLALANKESVVCGASFIFDMARENNCKIIPVDSEHSAIYNLLKNREAKKLIITASGGPFFEREDLTNVSVEEALNHPTWKMGKKITIDSATLCNKGLEVIEASYLFDKKAEDIIVTIHRQSIVHSLIETKEGAIYAQLSPPDMTLPIVSALSDGKIELEDVVKPLSFDLLSLSFCKPDYEKFPLLKYAFEALKLGYYGPIVYNAADEIAVEAFLSGKINFLDIEKIVHKTLYSSSLHRDSISSFLDVFELDRLARNEANRILEEISWKK